MFQSQNRFQKNGLMNGLGVPKQSEEPKGSVMLPLAVTSPQTERGSKERSNIMTINTYAENVRDRVAEMTGKEVEVRKVTKANEELTAIVIRDGNVGMNFYVDYDFNYDTPIEDCAEKIADSYDATPRLPFDAENLDFGFESIKDKLVARVLDMQRNKSFLEDAVYEDVGCGLALVADIVEGDYRITVRKGLAESNHYDKNELFSTALKNGESGAKLMNMTAALFGGGDNVLESGSEVDGEMFVLSNKKCFFGASTMFCNGMLEKIKDVLGGAFFVLPSSIHEVIIVPDSGDKSAKDLKEIVVTANKTVLEPKDILSDNVYRFGNKLEIVA